MTDTLPFLSVILPTFNRRSYITRMIDSVLKQDFKNYELIIIDDGSTDGTLQEVKKKYNDSRIRIAKKENGGVSSARNLGISLARGEYITFVDSDDYLLDGFLKDIFLNLHEYNGDVLLYGGYIIKDTIQEEVPLFWFDRTYGKHKVTINNQIWEFLKKFCMHGGNSWACAKVFRRELIQKNSIIFNETIHYGEDLLFNLELFLVASTIVTSHRKFYVADNNTKSLSRGFLTEKEKIEDIIRVYQYLQQNHKHFFYFAYCCLCPIRKWIFVNYFLLDIGLKLEIKAMYNQVPQKILGQNTEKIEFLLGKKNLFFSSFYYFCSQIAYRLFYSIIKKHKRTNEKRQ